MKGKWIDINVSRYFLDAEKNVSARAHFRNEVAPDEQAAGSGMIGVVTMANFIYVPGENRIIKNRHGNIETLYEDAQTLMSLRHHPNDQVRKAFERVETLAALAED